MLVKPCVALHRLDNLANGSVHGVHHSCTAPKRTIPHDPEVNVRHATMVVCIDGGTLNVYQSSTAVTIPSGAMEICLSTLLGTGLAHDCPIATHAAATIIAQYLNKMAQLHSTICVTWNAMYRNSGVSAS